MRLDGRRQSGNVEDRRGASSGFSFGGGKGKVAGFGGIAALAIAAIITWISGGNPLDVLSGSQGTLLGDSSAQTYTPTANEEELVTFTKQILAGTEDVWTEEFRKMGLTYEPPKLVMFTGSVNSGCGGATASTGPFYCSADQTVYIDLSFFEQMEKQMGAGGDFAYAYVIAHEVGHHVQYLLGTLDEAHSQMARLPEAQANQVSVRIELQADCYAGIWAYNDNKMFGSLEEGDIEEGLNAASKIGDDYLQKQAQGYAVPESFNHGRSEQRVKWLRRGATTGSLSQADTFSPPYSAL
ncbi:MAG: zinc metallopeptidase [Candidatus Amulumruptor caecigallinarius]|nr:zinc metallopeptidase [Candidatus Amulumruptor caecigallinarius]MCM1397379.1 zinc metallopeptidase [Candidatus Amulumruptor caecigallinarius]MCM1454747.1 zinc metallopeptidase [bacterium]